VFSTVGLPLPLSISFNVRMANAGQFRQNVLVFTPRISRRLVFNELINSCWCNYDALFIKDNLVGELETTKKGIFSALLVWKYQLLAIGLRIRAFFSALSIKKAFGKMTPGEQV